MRFFLYFQTQDRFLGPWILNRSQTSGVIYEIFSIFSDTRLLSLTSDSEEDVLNRSQASGVIYEIVSIFSDTRSLSLTLDSEEDVLNRSQTSGVIYKIFSIFFRHKIIVSDLRF